MKDALAAIEAGADYLGFNFYPKSVRFIEKETCAEITSVLKREYPQIKLVGVFVNSPVDEVKNILETCHLDLAQLHGDETPEMLSALAMEKHSKPFAEFHQISLAMSVMMHLLCWSTLPSKVSTAEAASQQIGQRRRSWRRNIRCCWRVD